MCSPGHGLREGQTNLPRNVNNQIRIIIFNFINRSYHKKSLLHLDLHCARSFLGTRRSVTIQAVE